MNMSEYIEVIHVNKNIYSRILQNYIYPNIHKSIYIYVNLYTT